MIRVAGLSKNFRLYKKPSDRLKEILLRKSYHAVYHALRDITFEVSDGETLGIIGVNGAGKSTLLKILTGVLLPDTGTIAIDGKITGLLELGTGFNMELTGIENIYTNGALLGMNREEIKHRIGAIIKFAELGDFIDEPMKTYSSGMVMRLGFATAIHVEPRCFVVDEALSVGDAYFQQKCMSRIRDFRAGGGSIIFVSHDMNAVKVLCNRAMLLDRGRVVESGTPDQVVNSYNYLIAKLNDHDNRINRTALEQSSYGTLAAEILSVVVTGEHSVSSSVSSGELTAIKVTVKSHEDIENLTLGILIRDKFGQDIFGTNSCLMNLPVSTQKNRVYEFVYNVRMDIGPGKYTVTAALHSGYTHVEQCYHWCDHITSFEVAGNYGQVFAGICKLYPTFASSVVD